MTSKALFQEKWGEVVLLIALHVFCRFTTNAQTCNSVPCPAGMYLHIIEDPNYPSTSDCGSTSACGGGDQFRQLFFKVRLVAYPTNGVFNFDLFYKELDISVEQSVSGLGDMGYSHIDQAATLLCHQQWASTNSWASSQNDPNGTFTSGVSMIAEEKIVNLQFQNNNFPCPDAAIIHFSQTSSPNCLPLFNSNCASIDLFTVVVNAYPGEVVKLKAALATYQSSGSPCPMNTDYAVATAVAEAPMNPISTFNRLLEVQLGNEQQTANGGYTVDVNLVNTSANFTYSVDYLEFVLKVATTDDLILEIPGDYDRPPLTGISTDRFVHFVVPDEGWTLGPSSEQLVATISIRPTLANIGWDATLTLLETGKSRVKTVVSSTQNCTSIKLGDPLTLNKTGDLPCTFDDGGVKFTIEGLETYDCVTPFTQKVKVGFRDFDPDLPDILVLSAFEFDIDFKVSGSVELISVNFPSSGWSCSAGCFGVPTPCYLIDNGTDNIRFSYCQTTSGSFSILPLPDAFIELVFEGAYGCVESATISSLRLRRNVDQSACVPSHETPPYDDIPICLQPKVFGRILTHPDEVGVEEVLITLEIDAAHPSQPSGCDDVACPNETMLTGSSGTYSFCACPDCRYFEVTPSKDDNPLNGVTTYDLVLISQHILTTVPFDSPYKMIAADANKSGDITTFDIVELRKLILGIYTELPNNTSWRFVKKTQTLQMPNPFQDVFEESIKADREDSPLPTHDFFAIKVGDVNNTASANRPSGERPQAALHFPEIKGQPGEVLTVPVVYGSGAPLQAMQFGLRFDPARLELIGPSLGDLPEWGSGAFNLSRAHEGELRTLWLPDLSGPNPWVRPGDVLFHLSFRVRPTGLSGEGEHLWLDDALLHCAAWSGEGEEHALVPVAAKATANAPSPGGGTILTATCHPNPGTGDLALSVVLPRPGKCRAALYSPFGVRLLAKDVALGAGAHEIPLDGAAQLPAGVYVWKVFSNGELAQGHWIKQ